MILTDAELLDILKLKPTRSLIEFGQKQRKRSRMHMYGVNMQEYLTMIEGFEKPWLHQLRLKYIQSNKDLMQRITKPINKVFTARGGNSYYNLDDKATQAAAALDFNIFNGMSIKKWMESFWRYHVLDDPMGLVFMEVDDKKNVYPTYKSTDDIHLYQLSGDRCEWVIFNVSKEDIKKMNIDHNKGAIYRVVDDVFDRIIIYDGNSVVEVAGQTFLNNFGLVPGITNSPFINPDGAGFITPIFWVLDLADQYLLKISIRLTHELKHGFPKYYEYADDCIKCKGSGNIKGGTCKECLGTGKRVMVYASDVKLLDYPNKDFPAIKGAPGGYIELSKTFSDIITAGLTELEERCNQTLWGSKTGTKMKPGMGLTGGPNGTVTATEVMDNRQPEIECLNLMSDAAESRDKFITDLAINYKIKKNYAGSSKNYGRRFLLEDPDIMLTRYNDSRKAGSSAAILYGLYEQYLEAKYQSDNVSLSLHKKLMKVEPFMHYTVTELQTMGATPEEIRKKIYYGEWLVSMRNDDLIMGSIEQLTAKFNTFVSGKPLPVKEEVLPTGGNPPAKKKKPKPSTA